MQINTESHKEPIIPLPLDFFKLIVVDLIEDLMKTDQDRLQQTFKEDLLDGIMKNQKQLSVNECIDLLDVKKMDNQNCPEIQHISVFQQNRGGLCGFHAYYNSKCFIRAILSKTSKDRVSNLVSLNAGPKFWQSYRRHLDILLRCTNSYYVNKSDKKSLVEEESPLERNHLRYLLMKDRDIDEFKRNGNCEVYLHPFLYAFGLFQQNIEQLKDMEDDIQKFRKTNNEAVFVLYLGVVNHWVTLVVYKEKGNQTLNYYLLDSSNLEYLNKSDEQLPEIMEKRSRDKEALGMKAASAFGLKMSIQSLFDLKHTFHIITTVMSGKNNLSQYYCSGFVHNILKQFHSFTETFNNDPTQLQTPKSRMYSQKVLMTEEEERSMSKYDIGEFQYPYKKVQGHYQYIDRLDDQEDLSTLFDLMVTFLLSCGRPQHIESDLTQKMHAFGKDGYFKEDIQILENWCDCIIDFDKRLTKKFGTDLRQEKGAKNYGLFKDLVTVVTHLRTKLGKKNWVQKLCAKANL